MESSEYTFEGLLQSDGLSGEVAITVAKDAVQFVHPLDQLICFYSDIRSFAVKNYSLIIDSAFGQLRVSQMGDALEWLFDKLWERYNDAVQKALFVDGTPIVESRGEYCYEDAGGRSEGMAVVRLFENCICILPPNEGARRIPFCFLRDMKEENYSLRLAMDTGEWYTFKRIGGYIEGFVHQLTGCLQAMQRKAQQAVQEICGGLNSMEATALARLMREGVAAPIGELLAISPAYVKAVEAHIAQSRAAEPYAFFKKACDVQGVCVGLKRSEKPVSAQEEEAQPPMPMQAEDAMEAQPPASPYTIFIVASKASPTDGVAAVELAVPGEESAATFFYRYQDDWAAFRRMLNRAMEAVSFRREVIWLGEDALSKPENAHYRMAIARTEALRFLRGCFAGRAIHSSPEAWQRETAAKLTISN